MVAVVSNKGGVGKTTVVTNLAIYLRALHEELPVALVTLWVEPKAHQIVKYTFDNVWLDFLPAAWLVRIDDLRASMTMGQPFPGVWLPRGMSIHAGLTLALGGRNRPDRISIRPFASH